MINVAKIEQLARQIQEAIPQSIREFSDDIEKKIHQLLQAQLMRMNLVNREEFDAQVQVLLHTREKLALLEQRLSVLEEQKETTLTLNSSESSRSVTSTVPTSTSQIITTATDNIKTTSPK